MPKEEKYISLNEAAIYSGCYSQEYLSLRARQGKLKATKIGRNWVTTKEWVDEYIERAENYKNSFKDNRNRVSDRPNKSISAFFQPVSPRAIAVVVALVFISGGLVFGYPYIKSALNPVRDFVSNTTDQLKYSSDELATDIWNFSNDVSANIRQFVFDTGDEAKSFIFTFASFGSSVGEEITRITDNISEGVSDFRTDVYQNLTRGVERVEKFYQNIFIESRKGIESFSENLNPVRDFISGVANQVSGDISNGINFGLAFLREEVDKNLVLPLANVFSSFRDRPQPKMTFAEYVQNDIQNLKKFFKGISQNIGYKITGLYQNVVEGIKGIGASSKELFVKTRKGIGNFEGDLKFRVISLGEQINESLIQPTKNTIVSVPGEIAEGFSKAAKSTARGISKAAKTVSQAISYPFVKTYQFVVRPWQEKIDEGKIIEKIIKQRPEITAEEIENLRAQIEKLKEEGIVAKEIVKEVTKITQIEPVKEITREIKTLDDESLKEIRTTLNQQEAKIEKLRLAADSGYIHLPPTLSSRGAVSITTLGTITTGTWQGNLIADEYITNDLTLASTKPASISTTDSNPALTISQSGTGNIVSFQKSGTPIFEITNTGALNATGTATSTWQIIGAPLTIQTATSGDIVLASADNLIESFVDNYQLKNQVETAILAIDTNGNISATGTSISLAGPIAISGDVTTTANVVINNANLKFINDSTIEGTGTLTINPTGPIYFQSAATSSLDESGNLIIAGNLTSPKIISPKLEYSGNITINAASSTASTTVAVTNENGDNVANLQVEGDIQIEGGKITLASGETIDAETEDQLRISASTSTLILINDTQRVAIDSQGMEVTGMTTTTDLYVSQSATIVGTFQVQATTTLATTTITKLTVSGPSEFQNNFTISGAGNILFSTAGTIRQTGTGQVTFAGNVDATNGLDVTNAALTAAAGFTVSGGSTSISGSSVSITPSGAITLTAGSDSTWKTTAGALTIRSAANLIATSTNDIILATAGSERMRLLSTGEIGVGTSTPTGIFEVATSTGASVLYVGKNGNIGIGTTAPSSKLEVNGNVELTNLYDNDASNFFDGSGSASKTLTSISSNGTLNFTNIAISESQVSGDIEAVTAGNGLTGGGTEGSVTLNVGAGTGISVGADSISALYGSTAGTAVQGNTQLTISAGSGLTGGDTITLGSGGTITLSHADTSSQASIDTSGGVVIQDVTLDTYGHITSLETIDLDTRYYTESEAGSRFVNVTGDTMTGDLWFSGGTRYIGTSDNNDFVIRTNNTDRIFVDNDGNVGIGTANPGYKLDVNGDVNISSGHNFKINGSNLSASDIDVLQLGSPTYTSIQDLINTTQSAGKLTGGDITDNGNGTVSIAAGTGLIRTTDSDTGELKFFDWSTSSSVSLTDNSINYIYVDYNSGSPQIGVYTSIPSDTNTKILLGCVYKEGTDLHITTAGQVITNYIHKDFWKDIDLRGKFQRVNGLKLSETGTRNIALTAGSFYAGLTKVDFSAFDSSGGDTFTYYYRDGDDGWTKVTDQTQIDNTHYDDGSGTLATLSGPSGWRTYYGVHWVYADIHNNVFVLYGQGDYLLSDAQNAQPPASVPDLIYAVGFLVGKIIIEKNASSFESVESAFDLYFVPSVVSSHNELAGLQGGTADEYYHLTNADYTELTVWIDDVTLTDGGVTGLATTTITGDLTVNTSDLYVDTATGNVGIGTTSPAYKLDVNGIVNATQFYQGGSPLVSGYWDQSGSDIYYTEGNVSIGTTTANARLTIQSTSTDDILSLFETGGTEVLTVLESGYVGIGTTTPDYKLHVWGSAAFGTSTTPTLYVHSATGRVGIGTTSPAYTLDVSGDIRWTGTLQGGTVPWARLSGYPSVSAGSGLTGGGSLSGSVTLSHADTSSQTSSDNSNLTFIQDVTLDEYGHVTGLGTAVISAGSGLISSGTTLNVGAGAGISVAADSISALYGSTAGTAVQGNTQLTISAGSGLTGGDTITLGSGGTITLSHADTSTQGNVDNSDGTVIQDVTLDDYGHVTGLASYNLDNRYFTETEADSRYVNVTGDTMTGNLWFTGETRYIGTSDNNDFVIRTNNTDRIFVDNGGYVGIGTTNPQKKLDVLHAADSPQLRLGWDTSRYAELYVDAAGDLIVSASTTASYGRNVRMLDENLWVCSGGACAFSTTTDRGNVIVENALIFDNKFQLKQTSSTTVTMYDSEGNAILIFDEVSP